MEIDWFFFGNAEFKKKFSSKWFYIFVDMNLMPSTSLWYHSTYSIFYFLYRTTVRQDQVGSKKSGNVIYNFGNYAAATASLSSDNPQLTIMLDDFTNNFNNAKYLNPSIRESKILEFDRVYELGQEIVNKIIQVHFSNKHFYRRKINQF